MPRFARCFTVLGFAAAILWSLTACGVPTGRSISHRLTYLTDPAAKLDAAEVMARPGDFQQADSDPPFLGFRKGHVWFHLELEQKDFARGDGKAPGHNKLDQVYLQIEQISLSYLAFFQDGKQRYSTVTWTSFAQRPLAHRTLVFPVRRPASGSTRLLFRVRTHSIVEVPLVLWKPADFHDAALVEYAVLGTFIGVVLIMAGYNFILALTIREKSYYLYVLYTLSIGMFALQEDAIVHHLFRTTGRYFILSLGVIYGSVAGTGMLFARAALNTRDYAPRLDRLLLSFGMLSLVSIPLFLFEFSFPYRTIYFNVLFALVLVLTIGAIAMGIRAGSREARIFALAFGVFFASAIARLFFLSGLVESSGAFMRHGVKIGIAAELTILSLMLADRFNRLRDDYFRARLKHAEERSNLIGEVHDSIGSRLSAALMQVREGGTRERIMDILQGALENARDITAILRLSDKPEHTLEKEARDTVAVFQGMHNFSIRFAFDGRLNISASRIRVEILRVFQEWMNNSVRHGRARNLEIAFKQREGLLLLRIKSDGRPFAWSSAADPAESTASGSGLSGIRARCRRIGGRARSRAMKSGRGTVFVLRVPIIAGDGD